MKELDHRAIYGAGFHAGLRAAGETMNAEKAKRIEVNLSGVEKKIFEAVPIGEAWDTGKMGIELRRLGHNIDPRTITACCGKLAGTKLIREPKKGWFRKNVFREKQEHIKLVKDFPIESFEPEICEMSEKKDLLAVLGTATAKIREAANEIEEAALAIQAEAQSSNAETKKLAQLKELLKSL